jgi:hypothetical protein
LEFPCARKGMQALYTQPLSGRFTLGGKKLGSLSAPRQRSVSRL